MELGKDISGKIITIGQKVKRDDGVIGSFNLKDFELAFVYEEIQDNGAVCSYINHGRLYEIV